MGTSTSVKFLKAIELRRDEDLASLPKEKGDVRYFVPEFALAIPGTAYPIIRKNMLIAFGIVSKLTMIETGTYIYIKDIYKIPDGIKKSYDMILHEFYASESEEDSHGDFQDPFIPGAYDSLKKNF